MHQLNEKRLICTEQTGERVKKMAFVCCMQQEKFRWSAFQNESRSEEKLRCPIAVIVVVDDKFECKIYATERY